MNTQEPQITTVIPTYRRPKLLERAIRSVLNQTYPHLRVCIYDNASGDETATVVAKIAKEDSRVTYHCHQENIGPINNFQYGMERVDTPFFSLLSDDDVLLPALFEMALEGFENHPDAIFSATDVIYMDEEGEARGHHLQNLEPGYYPAVDGLIAMVHKGNLNWIGLLFRREVLDSVGFLERDVGYVMDLDYMYRVSARCPFVIDARPGAIFLCSNQVYFQTKTELLEMIANIRENNIPADTMCQLERKLLSNYQRNHLFICMRYLRKRDGDNAWKVAQDLSKSPGNTLPYIFLALLVKLSKGSPFLCSSLYRVIHLVQGIRLYFVNRLDGRVDKAAHEKREDINRLQKYRKYLLE